MAARLKRVGAGQLLTLACRLVILPQMTTNDADPVRSTSYLTLPGGRLAYDLDGAGPLVILVPGMGDLRSTYRFLAPALRSAGYAVASSDLRGHGDSDATFDSYGDVESAGDIVALIEELGGPAVVVGNSMGAASAVLVAAERPDLVSGLVLIGPFVRDAHMSRAQRGLLRLAMATPWAAMSWKAYLPKLYAGRLPADFDEYRRRVVGALHRPGHAKAFSLTTRTSHAAAASRLDDVSTSSLVVMGEQDPDFPDPKLEGDWIARTLHGQLVMVPDAGHYPQSQRPDVTGTAVLGFLETVTRHA